MGFWVTAALFVASLVASYLLRPKPPGTRPDRFQPPTAEEGAPIPVVFGTVKVSPNVVWWGNLKTEKVVDRIRFAPDQELGYRYRADMLLALCHGPVDELADIQPADHSLAETKRQPYMIDPATGGVIDTPHDATSPLLPVPYAADGTEIAVQARILYGGREKEGGIWGNIRFYFGSATQGQDPYLALQIGADRLSSYRGLCYAALKNFTLGQSPYPKPILFVVRRFPNALGNAALANINGDANPAEVLYEALTNRRWGCRKPAALLGLATFQAAAETLFAEGLGISTGMTIQEGAEGFVERVLQHVDGALYTHPQTGLLSLKLIRADYVLADLLRLSPGTEAEPGNASALQYSEGGWHETANEVRVTYSARVDASVIVDGANRVVPRFAPGAPVAPVQNLAAVQGTGEVFWETHDFPYFASSANAALAAQRVLRARSVPLGKAVVTANREAYALHPGAAFVLAGWGEPGIEELVMRVVKINYGRLEAGRVEIEAVQDAFDASGIAYAVPPDAPENPVGDPLPVTVQRIVEAPYFDVGAERAVYVLAARRDGTHDTYDLWANEGGAGYAFEVRSGDWSPTGQLESAYLRSTAATDEAGFVLTNVQDLDLLTSTDAAGLAAGNIMAVVGDEVLSVRDVTDLGANRYRFQGVLRGQLDTVPLDHAAGAVVHFYRPLGAQRTSADAYAAGTTVAAKVLPINPRGQVALADATELSLVVASRALKPYPPGNVRLNGLGYDAWPASTSGDVTLSWSHRSRTGQSSLAAQDTAGSYTLEGTVTLEILIGGVVVSTIAGLTGTSFAYTYTTRQGHDADLNKPVVFRLTPVNGSLTGTVRTTPPFVMGA